jgi:hypothetical protein
VEKYCDEAVPFENFKSANAKQGPPPGCGIHKHRIAMDNVPDDEVDKYFT